MQEAGLREGVRSSKANGISNHQTLPPLGDAKSLRTAETSNWSGKAVAAPRTEIDELLDTLGGNSSIAWGINNAGQIVGVAETASGDDHAFLYECGMIIDLNSLLAEASGWQLYEARAIDDSGKIVGWGFSPSGEVHAFLLALDEDSIPRRGSRSSARVACRR